MFKQNFASVAQWQSNCFVNSRSSVQIRPLAPVKFYQEKAWVFGLSRSNAKRLLRDSNPRGGSIKSSNE